MILLGRPYTYADRYAVNKMPVIPQAAPHTPGPWVARRQSSQVWHIDAPKGDPTIGYSEWKELASVYGSDDYRQQGELVAEANARLIAEAPAMLEALKQWALAEASGDEALLASAQQARDAALVAARATEKQP